MKCIFYGIGSTFLYEVQETVERLGWTVEAYISNMPDLKEPADLGPIVRKEEIGARLLTLPVVFPLITPGHRKKLQIECSELGFSEFASVVDPTATLASRVEMRDGVYVNARAIVAANTQIGRFAVINRGASIGHDSVLQAFVCLGPGAIVCGSCCLGAGCFIGAGAIISPKISIGRNSIVGAGAVVLEDLPDNSLAVGNPARIVKEGIVGYNDTAV